MKPAPLCRYCGKEIAKSTRTVYLRARMDVPVQSTHYSRYLVIEDDSKWPRSRADCQKLTDWKVVSISRDTNMDRVWSFNEWDGESYIDNYFCKGEHAKQFGYLAASEGRATVNYNRGLAEQMRKTA